MRQLKQLLWLTAMRFKVLSNKECSNDYQASSLYINSHINQFNICQELIAGLTANEYLKYTFESQKCTLHKCINVYPVYSQIKIHTYINLVKNGLCHFKDIHDIYMMT